MAILQQQLTQGSTASPNSRYVMQPTQLVRIGPLLDMAEFAVHSHMAIIDVRTRPSGPARGPAKVNSKVGDGDSPG